MTSQSSRSSGGGLVNGNSGRGGGAAARTSTKLLSLSFVVKFMALPYLLGYWISANNVDMVRQLLSSTPVLGGIIVVTTNSTTNSTVPAGGRRHQQIPETTTIWSWLGSLLFGQRQHDSRHYVGKEVGRLLSTEDDVELCYQDMIRSATPPAWEVAVDEEYGGIDKGDDDSDQQKQQQHLTASDLETIFGGLSLVVSRNGETTSCGSTGATADLMSAFRRTLRSMPKCPNFKDRYEWELFLTRLLQASLVSTNGGGCARNDVLAGDQNSYDGDNEEVDQIPWRKASSSSASTTATPGDQAGFYGYCYAGEDKTPILPDHNRLVPLLLTEGHNDDGSDSNKYLPCHFHNEHGQMITSMWQLVMHARETAVGGTTERRVSPHYAAGAEDDDEDRSRRHTLSSQIRKLHLYAVPAGRHFMFAPTHVGQMIHLPHVKGADPTKGHVTLEVLSLQPRVFEVSNLFTEADADSVVRQALAETRDTFRLQRSSAGSNKVGYPTQKTSECAFVVSGDVTMAIKKYVFADIHSSLQNFAATAAVLESSAHEFVHLNPSSPRFSAPTPLDILMTGGLSASQVSVITLARFLTGCSFCDTTVRRRTTATQTTSTFRV